MNIHCSPRYMSSGPLALHALSLLDPHQLDGININKVSIQGAWNTAYQNPTDLQDCYQFGYQLPIFQSRTIEELVLCSRSRFNDIDDSGNMGDLGCILCQSLTANRLYLNGMNETFFQMVNGSQLIKNAKSINLFECSVDCLDLSLADKLSDLRLCLYRGCLRMPTHRQIDFVELCRCDVAECKGIDARAMELDECRFYGRDIDEQILGEIRDLFPRTNVMWTGKIWNESIFMFYSY